MKRKRVAPIEPDPAAAQIAAYEATLAHARELVTDLVMAKHAAEIASLKTRAAISRGRRTSKVLPPLQKAIEIAELKIGQDTGDAALLAYLIAHKRVPLTTRRSHIKRARAALRRRYPALPQS